MSETTWPRLRSQLVLIRLQQHQSSTSPQLLQRETPLLNMLFLPAAALCCLCSALVAMAAELTQDQLSLTRRVGENVSFSCEGTGQCGSHLVFWYQNKEKETFTLILHINRRNGEIDSRYNHPQKDDFSAVNKQNGYEPVVKPVVSVYPAAPRAHLEGRSSLLCVASDMSPPLVQFSWKRQRVDGPLEELPPGEVEQLEHTQPGRTTSILLIHQPEHSSFLCCVRHEGGLVEVQTQAPAALCPPERQPGLVVPPHQGDLVVLDPLQAQCRVRLLCLLYTVLIVKSLLYC
ncbi:hypothetical protein INR49_024704 [Caranx melampygus]|nr:hypothetical protein INR49_024704 [Caranx melampygus]